VRHGKYLEIMEDPYISFDELHKKYIEIMKEPSVSLDELEKKLSGDNNKLFSEESVREVINKPEDI
jgi:hypothetical protein